MIYHTSVLLEEVIDLLLVKPGKKYIDATLGGGGHAVEIVNRGGIVLGIDADQEAIDYCKDKFKSQSSKVKIIRGNFRDIDQIARSQGFGKVAGVIFDLGVSSRQIEKGNRGFSYQKEGPLDMRMNQDEKLPRAADILNLADRDELYKIFNQFGEEPRAFALASAVVRARKVRAFVTTDDLLQVIESVYGVRGAVPAKTRAQIAKRVFQALRIAVNSELESLKVALPKAVSLLEGGGRLAVISFHSLEDRIVKQAFLNFQELNLGKVITEKPISPSLVEKVENRRSRSAKLRVFEKA